MNLLTLPARYARAKWLRTMLLVAIFALGVASMTGLHQVSQAVGESLEKKLLSYGANILVTPKREVLTVSYGGYALGDVTLEEHWIPLTKAMQGINAMPLRANVAIIAPKLIATARINGKASAVVGVDWQEELALKGYWEVQGEFPSPGASHDALVGASLAHSLGITPGQTLQVQNQEFTVRGVLLPTGSDDDAVLFAPLAAVQTMAGKPDQATFLEVAALCSGCPIEDIVLQLQEALPGTEVKALRQVAESRMYAVHFAQDLAFYVSVVILVTALAMIIMSMLSSVNERKKEIGIMRAVGFSRSSVFAVFVSEALGIGALAGLVGYVAGGFLATYVLASLHLTEGPVQLFSLQHLLATTALVAGAAALAAAFPAWKASLVEPADSLAAV